MARHTNPDGADVDTHDCPDCGRPFASAKAVAGHAKSCPTRYARLTAELDGGRTALDPNPLGKHHDTKAEEPLLAPCSVSARRFALAWRAVFAAASDDIDRPEIRATVLLEQHDDRGLRLVATDTVAMLWTWVGYTEADHLAPPELEELPSRTLLVADYSGLPKALFAHIVATTKTKEGVDRLTPVRMRVGVFEQDPNQPTLGSAVDRDGLILSFDNEAIALPVAELDFPTWRTVAQQRPTRGLKRVGFRPDYLRLLGSIATDDRQAVELDLLGKAGIALTIPGDPVIYGRVMPVRLADADEDEEHEAA